MCEKAVQNMVAVLPNRLRHDQWFIGGNFLEDLHSVLLAVNESMPLCGIEGMGAFNGGALCFDRGYKLLFHFRLGSFAGAVCFDPQVAVCNEMNGFHDLFDAAW